MKRLYFLLLLIVLLGMAACNGNSEETDDDQEPSSQTQIPNTAQSEDSILAARVNNTVITLEQLAQEVESRAQAEQVAADPFVFEQKILDEMIDQVLIAQYAAENGLVISDEQVQAEIEELTRLATEANVQLTDITGYPEAMTATKVREILLLQAVSEAIIAGVPTTTVQVRARHILVKDEATAQLILQELNAGASFGDLAKQYSQDNSTAAIEGNLGWIYPGVLLQPEIEQVIFNMPPNSRYPEPIPSILGYHIVEVLERDEARPLEDDDALARLRQATFEEWLAGQRAAASITIYLGADRSQP